MSRLTKWIAVPVLAVAATFMADAPEANAQGFSLSIGTGGFSYGHYGPSRYSSYYATPYRSTYGYRSYGPVIYPGYSTRYRSYARPLAYPPVYAPYRGPRHVHGHHSHHGHHGHHHGRPHRR
ncbi:MAG: hypothetical protein ACF8AM_13580 [Rhodopirellula sp. JB055]|uniref:hypothetical protein n=1 Tax=Rhodopirellula sp. JB055 TaxID=3342846 RepID=UPI00370B1F99